MRPTLISLLRVLSPSPEPGRGYAVDASHLAYSIGLSNNGEFTRLSALSSVTVQ